MREISHLIYARKPIKKWKKIKLEEDKKFNFITVIDFGLVLSTNGKKMKELKKQDSLRKKGRQPLELTRKLVMAEVSRQKRKRFFMSQEKKV